MSLSEVRADCKLHRDRIGRIDFAKLKTAEDVAKWVRHELLEQLFPLIEAVADSTEAEITEIDGAVEALAAIVDADDEEGLAQETAEQILGVFNLGKQLATEFEPLIAKADELKRKRLRGMLKAFRRATEVVAEIVTSLVIVDEPEAEGPPDVSAANDDAPAVGADDGVFEDGGDDVDDGMDAGVEA